MAECLWDEYRLVIVSSLFLFLLFEQGQGPTTVKCLTWFFFSTFRPVCHTELLLTHPRSMTYSDFCPSMIVAVCLSVHLQEILGLTVSQK